MSFNQDFYAENRFGSAAFADEAALQRAGLFGSEGVPLGFFGGRQLRLAGDAPLLTIAGAGAGKLTTVISYAVTSKLTTPMLVLDPRGEIAATFMHNLAPAGVYGYCWSPISMHGLPQHRTNLLSILKRGSARLKPDADMIFETLIAIGPQVKEPYFKQRVRDWCSALSQFEVDRTGSVTLPRLYRLFQMIDADPGGWADCLSDMLKHPDLDIRGCAGEMLIKQQDAPREFSAILGELQASLGFLRHPALQEALSGDDFSLDCLVNPDLAARVHLNVPAEYLGLWSPVIRLFFALAMIYKRRAPQAPRILLLVDEAGQLGAFDQLRKAFTFGRGDGVRAWAFFQDTGQIERNYGREALQEFMGSAQLRQFFGVRDYQTARLVSDMLGQTTQDYDDTLQQSNARWRRRQIVQSVMQGADPFEAATSYGQADYAAQHRSRQARALLNPDEVLALPEDRQILFISGKSIGPVLGERMAYYLRRDMAGSFLNNPMHPPPGVVTVRTRMGSKSLRICEGPVNPRYAHYPQYQSGLMRWVEGYPL